MPTPTIYSATRRATPTGAHAPDDWRDRSECLDEDPELFFPHNAEAPAARQQVADAKAVCARCPVVDDCLRDAIDRGDPWSIAGGMTPKERSNVRRRAARATRAGEGSTDEQRLEQAIAGARDAMDARADMADAV